MTRPAILTPALLALALALAPGRVAPAAERAPAQHGTSEKAQARPAHGETPQEAAERAGEVIADDAHGKAGEHAEEPNFLAFQPSLMATTVIIFGLLLAILWRFAWGPLSEALAERERKQEETVRAAEDARAESARLLAEHKRQMDTAAEQVRQMLDEARRQADANAQTILQKAQAEAEAEREKNKREITSAKDQALAEIWTKTADLAVSVAGRVLSREMTGDDQRRLVDAAMGELPSANGGRHA